MIKLVLLLLVLVGLAVFVLQNLAPLLSLTVLGFQTPALPLSVWVVGAIALGALSTLLTASLLQKTSRGRSRRRSSRPRPRVPSGSSDTPWTPPSWTGRAPQDKTTASRPEDDWSAPPVDDWDEWAGVKSTSPRPRPSSSATYDADIPSYQDFRDFQQSQRPEDLPYDPRFANDGFGDDEFGDDEFGDDSIEELSDAPGIAYPKEQDEWDDWQEDDEIPVAYEAVEPAVPPAPPPPPPEPEPPAREIIEIRRTPQTAARSGTIYSYTYRTEEPEPPATPEPSAPEPSAPEPPAPEPEPTPSPAPEERVRVIIPPYQAGSPSGSDAAPAASTPEERVRVIIPPYHPDEPPSAPPSVPESPEEDLEAPDTPTPEEDSNWEDTDTWDEPASSSTAPEEDDVWDDWDDWEEDDWEEDSTAPSSRRKKPPSRRS